MENAPKASPPSHTSTTPRPTTPTGRRDVLTRAFLPQWLVLGAVLLIIGGAMASALYARRSIIESAAQDRLAFGARSVAMQFERRLTSIDSALRDLQKNLPGLRARQGGEELSAMYLETVRKTLDGVRTTLVFDAQGTVTASSRPELVGQNFRQRDYFQMALNRSDARTLYIPAPYETILGAYTLNVFHATFDAHDAFSGIVSATLDPEALKPILAALRYIPDVAIGVVHGDGKVLLSLASPQIPPQTNIAHPDSFFSRHIKSGKEHSILKGSTPVLPNDRLAAAHTINPPALAMSAPLVVVVSQDLESILRNWHDDVRTQGILFALLAGLSALGLFLHQRRQRYTARLRRLHQRERQHDLDRLALATQASGTGIWELDLRNNALIWDETMYQLYGKVPGEQSSTYADWRDSVLPDDLSETEARLREAIEKGRAFETQFRIRRGDGEIRSMDARAWVYSDEAGQPTLMIGVNRDITHRQRLEQSLRESRELAAGIIDSLVQHIAVINAQGIIVRVNQTWLDFARANGATGPTLESVGLNYLDICRAAPAYEFGAEAFAVLDGIQDILDGRKTEFSLEYACHSPNEKRWFILHATPLCAPLSGAVIAHENITARRLAEDEINRAHHITQQFLDHLPGTAYVKDENLRVLLANRAFQSMLGLDPAAIIGKSNIELFPNHFGRKLDEDDRRVLAAGQSTIIEESFEGRFFESNKFVIEGEGGRQLLGGITLDVTERHRFFERQEALLKISELGGTLPEKEFLGKGLEMLEQLSRSQIGFLHFVNADQQSIELITWTAGALKGCTAVHDSHYPLGLAGIWADCARDQKISVFNDYPSYGNRKGLPEGHAPLQRLISVPIIEEGQVRMILGVGNKATNYDDMDCISAQMIGNDLWRIVRRERAELSLKTRLDELTLLNARLDETNNKLLQSEKLASIGQLAAGVAHEINNPIGYVSSNLNSLSGYVDDLLALDAAYHEIEERLGPSMAPVFENARRIRTVSDHDFIVGDIQHLLSESREGLERVRKIVQDLKDFSRVGGTGWQRFNLHQGLESTLNIVWNEIKYKAEVDREYGDLPDICCIPSQINQVFMNLLTNAAQSIVEHGHIVLRSERESDSVWVEVQDDGAGISPENLERIFEPFYTTKPVGQGTGLGVSLSWGIIQRHHGRIEVRSTPGQGTTFRITLPIDPPPMPDTDPSVETER